MFLCQNLTPASSGIPEAEIFGQKRRFSAFGLLPARTSISGLRTEEKAPLAKMLSIWMNLLKAPLLVDDSSKGQKVKHLFRC